MDWSEFSIETNFGRIVAGPPEYVGESVQVGQFRSRFSTTLGANCKRTIRLPMIPRPKRWSQNGLVVEHGPQETDSPRLFTPDHGRSGGEIHSLPSASWKGNRPASHIGYGSMVKSRKIVVLKIFPVRSSYMVRKVNFSSRRFARKFVKDLEYSNLPGQE